MSAQLTENQNTEVKGELNKDKILDELMSVDEKPDVIDLEPEKKEEKEPEEKPEDKEEKEPEEKEPEETDIEELEYAAPATRKEILAKYPNIFKDFPYLEKALFVSQQYEEVFPTVDAAREAVESTRVLNRFEAELMQGKTETVLKAVKGEDQEAFNRIVDDYLPTLMRVDSNAYYSVIGNVTKSIINSMIQASGTFDKETGDILKQAAAVVNQFAFGDNKVREYTRLSKEQPEKDNKSEELEKRERAFLQKQFETARDSINERVTNSIKATIEHNIDPNESMTEYVRRVAIRECEEKIHAQIEKDPQYLAAIDKLWEKAIKDNFSASSMQRIRDLYISKARTLLPAVIKKARIEALRGLGKRVRDTSEDNVDNTEKSGERSQRVSTSHSSGKSDRERAAAIPKKMSTFEFLNQD